MPVRQEQNLSFLLIATKKLLKKLNIHEYQKVLVVNKNNGIRFETYVIETEKENTICVNGAASRLVEIGDKVIIMAFELVEKIEKEYIPKIGILNERNELIDED